MKPTIIEARRAARRARQFLSAIERRISRARAKGKHPSADLMEAHGVTHHAVKFAEGLVAKAIERRKKERAAMRKIEAQCYVRASLPSGETNGIHP